MTPTANGMTLTVHLGGHLHMSGSIWRGAPEDQPTAKGQGLGSGMGANKRLQLGVFVRGQGHRAHKRNGHGPGPYRERGRRNMTRACLSFYTLFTQNVLAQDLRNGHLAGSGMSSSPLPAHCTARALREPHLRNASGAYVRVASIAPSSQMLCLRVSGMT